MNMYYYLKVGQYPNISVNSDIVVDSTPKPNVVFEEIKEISGLLRSKGRDVNVFNLSGIKRSSGFLHFISEYIIEVKLGKEPGLFDWMRYSKDFLSRMWKFDKAMIDEIGLNSKVELVSISRKKKSNGFPKCKI